MYGIVWLLGNFDEGKLWLIFVCNFNVSTHIPYYTLHLDSSKPNLEVSYYYDNYFIQLNTLASFDPPMQNKSNKYKRCIVTLVSQARIIINV